MKLEAGKFYRTRSGLKARVLCTDAGGKYPCCGYLVGFCETEPSQWCPGGEYINTYSESDMDIVSEWVDEPKTKKVTLRRALYSNNGGFWLSEFTSFDREKTPGFLRWHDSIEVEVPVKE